MGKIAAALLCVCLAACVTADRPSSSIVRELAPTGKLRVAIAAEPQSVAADLARELAKRLQVPVEFVSDDANVWDVAFVARDPQRAKDMAFTDPYVIIEGAYMVPARSPLKTNADVDTPGVRIAVGRGSAYDLWLTRNIKRATLVRAPTSPAAIDLFAKDKLEVAAGVKQPLVEYAARHPEVRMLPGRFMVIEQAMATPRGRLNGAIYLGEFVDEMKASGFVAQALERSGQKDAAVAP